MEPRRTKTKRDRARVTERLGVRPKSVEAVAGALGLGYFAARRHLEALVVEGVAVKERIGHAMGYRRA